MNLRDISPRTVTILIAGAVFIVVVSLVVGLLLRRAPDEELPTVSSTTPQNGQEDVLGVIPLEIIFQEDLSNADQANIDVNLNPSVEKTLAWSAADTLQVTLTQDLEKAATYAVSILYANQEIHSFSFTTIDKTQEQIDEELEEQAEGDELFAEAQKEWYTENPWYAQLPIVTDDYTIVYEPDTKKFRIRLTLGDNPLGAEIESAKARGLNSLEATGVDLNQYSYYYLLD